MSATEVEKGDSKQPEFLGYLAMGLVALMALFVLIVAIASLKGA